MREQAALFTLTPERIRQLAAAGVFDIGPDGKTNLQIALHAYCDFKRAGSTEPAQHRAADPAPLTADELRAMLASLEAASARVRAALHEQAPDPEPPLSTMEAAVIAGVTPQTCRNWARKYKLGPKVRGDFQIDRRLLQAHLRDRAGR